MGATYLLSLIYVYADYPRNGDYQPAVSCKLTAGAGELSQAVYANGVPVVASKHVGGIGVFLCAFDSVYLDGKLCAIKASVSLPSAVDAAAACLGDVPRVYEYDCHLLHLKSDGVDEFPAGAYLGVFGRSGAFVLYL